MRFCDLDPEDDPRNDRFHTHPWTEALSHASEAFVFTDYDRKIASLTPAFIAPSTPQKDQSAVIRLVNSLIASRSNGIA